jgi:hypothetical protein
MAGGPARLPPGLTVREWALSGKAGLAIVSEKGSYRVVALSALRYHALSEAVRF